MSNSTPQDWLTVLQGLTTVQIAGAALPNAPAINFTAGVSGSYDPVLNVINLTASGGGVTFIEIPFVAGVQSSVGTGSWAVVGSRAISMTQFPATNGSGQARHVQFVACLENTAGATQANVQLYDVTHSVVITGTTGLNNTSAPSQQLPSEVATTDLTVGTASGDIRTDFASVYEVQLQMVGGTSTDSATCTSARIIIFYA